MFPEEKRKEKKRKSCTELNEGVAEIDDATLDGQRQERGRKRT